MADLDSLVQLLISDEKINPPIEQMEFSTFLSFRFMIYCTPINEQTTVTYLILCRQLFDND